jgi:nitrate/nitrite transport system substrate-binding protein
VVKALIRAGRWLDASPANRNQAVATLARPEYVGADAQVIANSMTGTFEYAKGDVRAAPDFNVFFRDHATYPFYSDAVWFLTQMRRWGQIPEAKTDAWYHDVAKRVYRPDVWREAAKRLLAEGKLVTKDVPATDGFAPSDTGFIDGIAFDARTPNAYLRSLPIGLKD